MAKLEGAGRFTSRRSSVWSRSRTTFLELTQPLKLTGPIVADIFLGKITKWNDARIAALNPGRDASDDRHSRRPSIGGKRHDVHLQPTTSVSVSPAWKSGPGTGKELQWPVGLGAKGNESVSGQVKQTPGALGYVELAYAKQSRLGTALFQNAAGQFVAPTADASDGGGRGDAAQRFRRTPTIASRSSTRQAPTAYPITSFTWLLVSTQQPDAAKAKKLADFLRWALTDGQKDAAALDYAPLPASLVTKLMPRIDSIAPEPAE